MSSRVGPVVAALFVLSMLAGCISTDDPSTDAPAADTLLTPVQDRHLLPFEVRDKWSHTLEAGPYGILDGEPLVVSVDLPLSEGGGAATGGATMHMGIFLPDVPEGTKVPVIADIGPYYSSTGSPVVQMEGDVPATERGSGRLSGFLIDNFVPHGYAVAQVSVFGTGNSGHCQDLMGLAEQAGIDAAVTALGEAEWSNGNVGLIGRSYDGSTPWQAATFGNEHLKTIVPISGLTGVHELMWRNGTAEWRGGTGVLWALYASMSVDGDLGDADHACKDTAQGPISNLGAYATGDHFAPAVNDYWGDRYFFDRALENYNGSVYYIHGLQDWNVDPHMAFPYYQQLIDAGFETKGLFGQWAHMYPDRAYEHLTLGEGRGGEATPESVRYDWAQDLLEWFDHYLAETGPKPDLQAEVQDNQGDWRFEETYPPQDATWTKLALGDDLTLTDGAAMVTPATNTLGLDETKVNGAHFTFGGFADDTRIAGMPRFHVTVTPLGEGGQLFAELRDKTDDLRLGHAVMDLRFAAGGKEMQPVVPGQPIVAKMEFEAFDVAIPAGHELELRVFATGEDYLPSAAVAPVQIDVSDSSVLKLPLIERGEETFFTPVDYEPCGLWSLRDSDNSRIKSWLEDNC